MDNDIFTEDQCSICSAWPAAERASLRRERFDSEQLGAQAPG
jgi:hypothetical protein